MVWIHGGGNSVGTAVDPIYDGRRLAEAGDVVVVTLNYRLAQLGFLADAALATTAGAVGNYGTLDQLEALDARQWFLPKPVALADLRAAVQTALGPAPALA